MSSIRLVPIGSTIADAYLTIPGHYVAGEQRFENTTEGWNAAVTAAQAKRTALIESLDASLGRWSTPEDIAKTADVQVRIDLRWKLTRSGGATDLVVESYTDVMSLRVMPEGAYVR